MARYENKGYEDLRERNTPRFSGDDGVGGAQTRRDGTDTINRKGNPTRAINVGVQKPEGIPKVAKKPITSFSVSGGGSGGVSDTREMQLGADLDPKAMMKKGYKKGGSIPSASKRADGIAKKGKTKGRIC